MKTSFLMVLLLLSLSCAAPVEPEISPAERAKELAQRFIVVDGHIDIPYRLEEKMEDISQRTESGDFDYPRAKEGGLDAPFMSIYVPASYQESGGSKDYADGLIDMVEKFQADWPDKFEVARSVADVRRIVSDGKIALPMGMENGAPIEGDLANLRHFHERGIRYITLTHARANHICDSSYDPNRPWKGLSDFGKQVVAEMNRLGMMIDVSHISDDAFYQVIELTKAPVIASHSSARHFTPGWERNMDDDMIGKLGENGGVIMINYGSAFLSQKYLDVSEQRRNALRARLEKTGLEEDDPQIQTWLEEFDARNPRPFAAISDVADHIDHVRKLVGIDHVGLGSDFDGVGDSLPTGLKDVSQIPNLFALLIERGYGDEDIEKIASGNVLRAWSEVERVAAEAAGGGN